MTQAAMQARLPAAPVSPAYSLMSQDHLKLKYLFDLIKPAVVMVQDGPTFEKALKALDLTGVTVVHVARPCEGIKSVAFADLAATPVTKDVEESIAKITPDTVGKLLFTSGSTGMPKAVINTQEMMCANAAMMMQVRPRDPNGPLSTYLDWMPWNHTMGGNAAFNPVLIDGGTLYIDDGRPMPGQFEETMQNLREVSPTYYANVPAGYAALAAAMEKDDALCRSFFKNLGLMAYGGARLPDDLYDRMQALAVTRHRRAHRVLYRLGLDRDRADLDRHLLGHRARRPDRPAVPRRRTEDGAVRLEIRTAAARHQRHAGLFRPARSDEEDVRRGRLLLHRRCRRVRRSTTIPCRASSSPAAWSRISSSRPAPSSMSARCAPMRSPPPRRWCMTRWSPGRTAPFIGLLAWPNLHACRQMVGNPDATYEDVVKHPEVIACLKQRTAGAQRIDDRRQQHADRARDADGRAALDRRQRTHRQGLHQPARRPRAPRRAGGEALCRSSRRRRDRPQ